MAAVFIFGDHSWLTCVTLSDNPWFLGGCFDGFFDDNFCVVSFGELELEVGLEQRDDAFAGLAARLAERDFGEKRHCGIAMWG
jgi:hypothetical protein